MPPPAMMKRLSVVWVMVVSSLAGMGLRSRALTGAAGLDGVASEACRRARTDIVIGRQRRSWCCRPVACWRSAHRDLDLAEAIDAAGHHLAPLDRADALGGACHDQVP